MTMPWELNCPRHCFLYRSPKGLGSIISVKMKTLRQMLEHRRAVRDFDTTREIDAEVVRACIEQAQLAPTSSNMQLWEAYHVVDLGKYPGLLDACLGQDALKTAHQLVVFVVRADKFRERAQANYAFETENILRHSPAERREARLSRIEVYYQRVIPLLYGRAWGLLGAVRSLMAQVTGLFRPVVRQVSEADVNIVRHKSCALVAQTFMLAMAEAGYDTCPLEGIDTLRLKRVLGLPRQAEVSMTMACGIRQGVRGERFRVPFSEQYHRL